jgi:hypothetical protein
MNSSMSSSCEPFDNVIAIGLTKINSNLMRDSNRCLEYKLSQLLLRLDVLQLQSYLFAELLLDDWPQSLYWVESATISGNVYDEEVLVQKLDCLRRAVSFVIVHQE